MRTVLPKHAVLVPPGARLAFEGVIFSTYQWQQKAFDGTDQVFEMLKRPDTVQVLAVKDEAIVLLRERQPGGAPYYSLPGGRHDREHETELDAARRELREETGMAFSDWKLLDVTQPHAKIEHFVYVFLATGFESLTSPSPDGGERIQVQPVGLDALKAIALRPDARAMPTGILHQIDTIETLLQFPAYRP
ncbi:MULTISPECIES: NUDIX hydrolase [Arthrobacter]|uniref:NUDIX domain-containing protein n=1 Tax=Arthrobacter terricola TaxID=2547396 RepID=A0A4V2ZSL8_9MICC|nr:MULTISPECIES: NUDIX domain-containing protein [Arthrobacter]MBT8159716.1 NUDIX domain-containing protein [Arthrobacter sp. GN70]TDF93664.1 NUDIX domain-containing protein [Arthrobacter terricola]